MVNLSGFLFTNRSDIANSLADGWIVNNAEMVNALAGNDVIVGDSSSEEGFVNEGSIDTGAGKDTISGTCSDSSDEGIYNEGTIDTVAGNDTIAGVGGWGIINVGTIDTGAGKDAITGVGTDLGINNVGTIDTGSGKDIVDALDGGFFGTGTTTLGSGKDTLKGFGAGNFDGGAGRDKILFGQGTYVINGGIISSGGVDMNVNGFESVCGANSGLLNFQNGTLTVNAAGVGTFA